MRVTISTTAEGFEAWSVEIDVAEGTKVSELKKILAQPPHSLAVESTTKILARINGVLTTLYEHEKVQRFVTLLNVTDDKVLSFPKGFIWGGATAAYQIEGAANVGGRSPSIWDTFAAQPGKITDGSSGAHACDHYHKFREDVALLKDLGFQAYRFSISWSRLLPEGRGSPNAIAVEYYTALVNELEANGIMPMVTLYHWDLPQCLEDEYKGWLSRDVVADFAHFAGVCFSAFGDKVKHWITLNEPWCAACLGYASGEHAPGKRENPDTEPYLVAHHMLLAHAQAVSVYRTRFKARQKGVIGITLNMDWKEPLTSSDVDKEATQRALDWQLGWFADPIYKGHYPITMRQKCGDRLPYFTADEQKLVHGSSEFFGLNHYSTDFVSAKVQKDSKDGRFNIFSDPETNNTSDPVWPKTDMGWDIVPWGFRRLVTYIHRTYSPPGGIYVTENGCAVKEDTEADAVSDSSRVEYLQGYLSALQKSIIEDGAAVQAYFVWSLLDNFEWAFGYTKRFGIVRVDFKTQERRMKASATFMSKAASSNTVQVPARILSVSDFMPYSRGPRATTPSTTIAPARAGAAVPDISIEDAKKMLRELKVAYEEERFQNKMVQAFMSHLVDGNDATLAKTRRNLVFPIQTQVLPKYGFEPTFRGVMAATNKVSSKEFMEDQVLAELNIEINNLTREVPQAKALEKATV